MGSQFTMVAGMRKKATANGPRCRNRGTVLRLRIRRVYRTPDSLPARGFGDGR